MAEKQKWVDEKMRRRQEVYDAEIEAQRKRFNAMLIQSKIHRARERRSAELRRREAEEKERRREEERIKQELEAQRKQAEEATMKQKLQEIAEKQRAKELEIQRRLDEQAGRHAEGMTRPEIKRSDSRQKPAQRDEETLWRSRSRRSDNPSQSTAPGDQDKSRKYRLFSLRPKDQAPEKENDGQSWRRWTAVFSEIL